MPRSFLLVERLYIQPAALGTHRWAGSALLWAQISPAGGNARRWLVPGRAILFIWRQISDFFHGAVRFNVRHGFLDGAHTMHFRGLSVRHVLE